MKGFQPRTPLVCDLRLCRLFLPRNSPFCDAMRALYNGEPRVQRPFKSHSSATITGIQCYMTTQLAHNGQAGARPSRHHLQPAGRDDNADVLSRCISSQSRGLYNNSPSATVIRVQLLLTSSPAIVHDQNTYRLVFYGLFFYDMIIFTLQNSYV